MANCRALVYAATRKIHQKGTLCPPRCLYCRHHWWAPQHPATSRQVRGEGPIVLHTPVTRMCSFCTLQKTKKTTHHTRNRAVHKGTVFGRAVRRMSSIDSVVLYVESATGGIRLGAVKSAYESLDTFCLRQRPPTDRRSGIPKTTMNLMLSRVIHASSPNFL